MEDQLVSYEVSKLAKKKGFVWKDRHYYDSRAPEEGCYYSPYLRAVEDLSTYHVLAPTQSLLQRWLRELYNLDCSPTPCGNTASWDPSVIHIILSEEDNTHWEEFDTHLTYEEALEQGLLFALNLLPDK